VRLSPAPCSLDLGDGSERGEYVDQDTVLSVLGRPHRTIGLMYCYYPFDKGWPKRASEAFKGKTLHAWGYPYDDYFPFTGGPKGDANGPVFQQMRDVRRHGQDVTLTLTMDCKVPDDHIRVIARQLKPFGRMRIRLNHECDGTWFNFNKRYTYEQVGRFFIRFAKVLKKEAPEIKLICCWGHKENSDNPELTHEKELSSLLDAADLWSTDKYVTLHWGWPFHGCEPGDRDKTYFLSDVGQIWKQTALIYKRFCQLTHREPGIEMGEFNADGDVGGEIAQVDRVKAFYMRVLKEKPDYLKAITFYQFRDRGRLGLERENPNNSALGVATPLVPLYKSLLQEPYFQPKVTWSKTQNLKMEWRASDDSDGLGWKLALKKKPVFLELAFKKEANLMVKAGKRWFYKKSGVEWMDVTHAAAEWGTKNPFPIVAFAPPKDGINPKGSNKIVTRMPKPRVRLHTTWKD
jgi:hypothetical protein